MKKFILAVGIAFGVLMFCFFEGRDFYQLNSRQSVTVWKTYPAVCYIMPYKYYGLFPPKENYVITNTKAMIDIICRDTTNIILFRSSKNYKIINNPSQPLIMDYNTNEKYYDSLFTYVDGHYTKYKKEVNLLSVDVLEGYSYINNPEK